MKRGKLGYTCYGVDYEVCDIGKGGCGGRKRSKHDETHSMDHEDSAAEDIREFVNRLLNKSPCRETNSSNN